MERSSFSLRTHVCRLPQKLGVAFANCQLFCQEFSRLGWVASAPFCVVRALLKQGGWTDQNKVQQWESFLISVSFLVVSLAAQLLAPVAGSVVAELPLAAGVLRQALGPSGGFLSAFVLRGAVEIDQQLPVGVTAFCSGGFS